MVICSINEWGFRAGRSPGHHSWMKQWGVSGVRLFTVDRFKGGAGTRSWQGPGHLHWAGPMTMNSPTPLSVTTRGALTNHRELMGTTT